MHERSLVRRLIEQVREEARVRRLGRLHAVRLELGEFSGVEPQLVELAFEELAGEYWDFPVRLDVTVTPLLAWCIDCAAQFRVTAFRFVCPRCQGGSVQILQGEEMRLVSLEVEPSPVREESAR